ncbi:MAG: HAD family hydrolase, partial [Candidatus Aminicenantes bacterium]|nr:HAD family hydrolase [Candidatus Aminicenantes bacterium]
MNLAAPSARRFAAVIFDLDGTLFDTLDDIALTMNHVLARRGLPSPTNEEYKLLVGDGLEEAVRRALLRIPHTDDDVAAMVAEYRQEYEVRWRDHSRPYPGIAELLRHLRARGIKTAVLSNKSHPYTAVMIQALLRDFTFDVVRGAMPEVPLKPNPAAALLTARELGVTPESVIFLGDTNVDMKTAVAAGMFPVGALWGFRSSEE